MFTLFDYLDPNRTEERRQAQRDDVAWDRARKENARQSGSHGAATPLLAERRELLASLSKMWEQDMPDQSVDVLNGCPSDFLTPRLARPGRTVPIPGLSAGLNWLLATIVSFLLLVGVLLLAL